MNAQRSAVAAGWMLVVGCSNSDVPEHEPTLGSTADQGDDGGEGTGGAGVNGDDTGPEGSMCWPDRQLTDPTLFQCVGVGAGMLEWEQYAGAWSPDNQPVMIAFPSEDASAPNVQSCCEAVSTPEEANVGCLGDCARAACNLAIDKLRAKLLAGPPAGCAGNCEDRFEDTLDTWASFIEANYDDCISAVLSGWTLHLPPPASASDKFPWGAGRSASLTATCSMDAVEDPYVTDQTCETSLNPPIDAVWQDWVCPVLDGDVELSGARGEDSAALGGMIAFRRGVCDSEPCWLEIERLEIETIPSPREGVLAEPVHASLAYPAFGLTEGAQGTFAVGMLGLGVTLGAEVSAAFTMANSAPTQIDFAEGFAISTARFSWEDTDVTITATGAGCYCTSCP